MFRLVFFFLSFLFLGAEEAPIQLTGCLMRHVFPAPRVVERPAYGWIVVLDQFSQQKIERCKDTLSQEDRRDLDLMNFLYDRVQVLVSNDEDKKKCEDFEGKIVTLEGSLSNPPYPYSALPIYQMRFDSCEIAFIEREDVPIKLKGKLILKLCPGPPEYSSVEGGDQPHYIWFLQMNPESFAIAVQTELMEIPDIMYFSNWNEVQLRANDEWEEVFCEKYGQEISLEGKIFAAHTAHHRAPFQMNLERVLEP